jgi:hypothetical protein
MSEAVAPEPAELTALWPALTLALVPPLLVADSCVTVPVLHAAATRARSWKVADRIGGLGE